MIHSLDFKPDNTVYINFQMLGVIADYEEKLQGLLIGLTFLRLIKFLEIPEFSGVTAKSIMDTMMHRSFIAFVTIFILVLVSFTITFHLSFGLDVLGPRDMEHSLLYLISLIFGGADPSVVESNKIFGMIIYLTFTFFTVFYSHEYVHCRDFRCVCCSFKRT